MPTQNSKFKIIALGIILVLILALVKVTWFDKTTLVTVVGEGKIKVVPQMVKFSVAVLNISSSSTLALADNNKIVNDVVANLKSAGVAEKDIQLAYVRLVAPQSSLGQTSWQAVNSADVTLRDISKFDNLVIQLYAAGAQSLSNIVFTTENSKDLEKEAVNLAIQEAKVRAKELAKSTGKKLGRMVSVSTAEAGEAGALSGDAKIGSFGGVISSFPTQIEIARQASIIFELR